MNLGQIYNIAAQYYNNHNFEKAKELLEQIHSRNGNNLQVLNLLGRVELKLNNFDFAEQYLSKVIELDKTNKYIDCHVELGLLFARLKKYKLAINHLEDFLEKNPKNPELKILLSEVYEKAGKYKKSLIILQEQLKLNPEDINILAHIANVYQSQGLFHEAIPYYKKILKFNPLSYIANNNLGFIYLHIGEIDTALELVTKACHINSHSSSALLNLALIKKFDKTNDKIIFKIKRLLNSSQVKDDDKAKLHFALAKIYQDLNNYDRAFFHAHLANKIETLLGNIDPDKSFDLDSYIKHQNNLLAILSEDTIGNLDIEPNTSLAPIFVMGMPRTGKSLIERLLVTHSKITGAGEIGVEYLPPKLIAEKDNLSYFDSLRNLSKKDINNIKTRYIERLSSQGRERFKYIIDTMPANAKYIGLLSRMFPNAKFIICNRDPMDLSILIFFKSFGLGNRFAYEFKNIAAYIQLYKKILGHWDYILKSKAITIDYKELITNTEKIYSQILTHLELKQENQRAKIVFTTDEIDIHKKYFEYIKPLIKYLKQPTIINSNNQNINKLIIETSNLYTAKKYQELLPLAAKILTEEPANIDVLVMQAAANMELKNIKEAIDILTTVLKLNPDAFNAVYLLAVCYQVTSQAELAYKYISKAVELNPEHKLAVDTYNKLENILKIEQKMKNETNAYLVSAFSEPSSKKIKVQQDCRILLESDVTTTEQADSYAIGSWDQYFKDLSYGSYRYLLSEKGRANRIRAWHYLFKNIAIIEKIYNSKKETINILDVGCSSGYLRRFLEGNYSKLDNKKIYYWGIDIREDMLLSAVQDQNNIESGASGNNIPSAFIAHDVKESLPFKSSCFDFIICFEMIKYLPIDQGKFLLTEFNRVLKPNSQLYLSTTSVEQGPVKQFMEALSRQENQNFVQEAGFNIINTFGSQTENLFLKDCIKSEHRGLYKDLLNYYPEEVVAAIICPLYPEYSTQYVMYCQKS